MAQREPYILAYDIRDPKRLAKLYRLMNKWGQPIQYSVFALDLTPRGVEALWRALGRIVDEKEDDVRLYAAPERGAAWYGRPAAADGFLLTGSKIMDILHRAGRDNEP